MVLQRLAEPRILQKTPGIALICTTEPSPSTICRASSSPLLWRRAIATPMFPIGPAAAELHLRAATTAHRRSMPAPVALHPASATEQQHWPQPNKPALTRGTG